MKQASKTDRNLVVDILSKSFDDNKSVNYVAKQDSQRKQRIRRLMEYSFDLCEAFGEVVLSDDRTGCALLLYNDQKRTHLNSILWDVKLAIGCIGLSRVLKVLERESKIKKHHPKDPFCYLWFIGVNPDNQNRGIGTHLLQEIISKCKENNRPIYLETSTLQNIPWYGKNGFEIFNEIDFNYRLFMLRRIQK